MVLSIYISQFYANEQRGIMKIFRSFSMFLLLSITVFGYGCVKAAVPNVPQSPLFILCFDDDQLNQQMKIVVTEWWNEGLGEALGFVKDMRALPANAAFRVLNDKNNFEMIKPAWGYALFGGWAWKNLEALKEIIKKGKGQQRPVVIIAGGKNSSQFVRDAIVDFTEKVIHSILLFDPESYIYNFASVENRIYNFCTNDSRTISPITTSNNGFVVSGDQRLRSKVINILFKSILASINFFENNIFWLREIPIVDLIRQSNHYNFNADLKADINYNDQGFVVVYLTINNKWQQGFDRSNKVYFFKTPRWTYYVNTQSVGVLCDVNNLESRIKNTPISRKSKSGEGTTQAIEDWDALVEEHFPILQISSDVSTPVSVSSSVSTTPLPITSSVSTVTVEQPVKPAVAVTPATLTPSMSVSSSSLPQTLPPITTSVTTATVMQTIGSTVAPVSSAKSGMPSLSTFMSAIPIELEKQGEMDSELLKKVIDESKGIVSFDMLQSLIQEYNKRVKIELVKDEFYIQKRTLDNAVSKICFIGDIHGSVTSITKILNDLKGADKQEAERYIDDDFKIIKNDFYIVFTGDYTDRGLYGVEVLYLLLRLKLAPGNWDKVFLLRGNHEDITINNTAGSAQLNSPFGFENELRIRFFKTNENKLKLFLNQLLNQFYNLLPQALLIGWGENWVLACHGCVMQDTLDQINGFKKFNEKLVSMKLRVQSPYVQDVYFNGQPCVVYRTSFLWTDVLWRKKQIIFDLKRAGLDTSNSIIDPKAWLAGAGIKAVFRGHQHAGAGLKMISKEKYDHENFGPVSWEEFFIDRLVPKSIADVECPIFTFTTARVKFPDGVLRLSRDVFYGMVTTNDDFAKWILTPHPIEEQTATSSTQSSTD